MITLKLATYSVAEIRTLAQILEQNRDLVVRTFCTPDAKCHACKVRHICEDLHSTTEHLSRVAKNSAKL